MKKLIALSLILMSLCISAQERPQIQIQEHPLLNPELDSNVRYGVLDNGLTYYIRHNEQPKNRAEFHIAQKVGAVLEEDSQNGLAHFLEHMAFNGTQHFDGKGIIEYFKSQGLSFGGDINAYTSIDETVYRLSNVPTVRTGVVDSALLVMHDWSGAISLIGEEIDAERGVIREEWRTGSNAMRRLWRESNKLKYPGSQYAKRDVIGDTAIINNFPYDTLRAYYKKWYGPDLQGIIVVGDVDVDYVEAKIKSLWKDIPERANRGVRPLYSYGRNADPRVVVVADPEATHTIITFECLHDATPHDILQSKMGYMLTLPLDIIETVISYRFDELTRKADCPIVAGEGGYEYRATKLDDEFAFMVQVKTGKEKEALNLMLTEIEKLRRYGITQSEFDRAKLEILNDLENAFNERNKQQNRRLTEQYIRHFLDGSPVLGEDQELEIAKMVFSQLTLSGLNEMIAPLLTDKNRIVCVMGKQKDELPNEEEIHTALLAMKDLQIEAPVNETLDMPLVEKTPKAGKKIRPKKDIHNNLDVKTTEITLRNGIKVVIKNTDFSDDEILFRAYSVGGLSMVEDDDVLNAYLAPTIIETNGVGQHSATQLTKLLSGKTVSIESSIDKGSEEIKGSSSVKDFETLLQLTYLYFTAPRQDDEAFNALMGMLRSSVANKAANPKAVFSDSVHYCMGSNSPRVTLLNNETIEKIDQQRALEIYKQRFANPKDFTFFFVGNIKADQATLTLINQWIGSLKTDANAQPEQFVKRSDRLPQGNVTNRFNMQMSTRTASNVVVYSLPMRYEIRNRITLRLLSDCLDAMYLESIREREGGSYGVGVYGGLDKNYELGELYMQFDTDPKLEDKLLAIIHEELERVANGAPIAEELEKSKQNLRKDYEQNIEKNKFWLNTILYRHYLEDDNYLKFYLPVIELVNEQDVRDMARQLLDGGNVLQVIMEPK